MAKVGIGVEDHVNSIIRAFVAAIEAQGITVEKALLFGSQARGNAGKDSDFDLMVISARFYGNGWPAPVASVR